MRFHGPCLLWQRDKLAEAMKDLKRLQREEPIDKSEIDGLKQELRGARARFDSEHATKQRSIDTLKNEVSMLRVRGLHSALPLCVLTAVRDCATRSCARVCACCGLHGWRGACVRAGRGAARSLASPRPNRTGAPRLPSGCCNGTEAASADERTCGRETQR